MKANLLGEILELTPTSDKYCPTEFLHLTKAASA